MHKFLRKTSWAVGVIASLFAANANASFVLLDSAWVPSPANAVPTINDFRGQLAGAGVPSFYLGRTLGVTGARAGDTIEIDLFAAEAGYHNQLYWGSTLVVNNQGNLGWAERDRGTFAVTGNTLNFRFCSVTIQACLSNAANDFTFLGSLQSIGMYLTDDGNTAWLLWDDSGAASDDNHDDLVVRLTYKSVPEPGTLALLGLGLIGAALVRRRKIEAQA
jgi:hypothetical protein